jgi:hypothetical protein
LGSKVFALIEIPLIEEEGKLILELNSIAEVNVRKLCNSQIIEYNIQWRGLPKEQAIWDSKAFSTTSNGGVSPKSKQYGILKHFGGTCKFAFVVEHHSTWVAID